MSSRRWLRECLDGVVGRLVCGRGMGGAECRPGVESLEGRVHLDLTVAEVGAYWPGPSVSAVTVNAGKAYVGYDSYLSILDVSAPAAPVVLGTVNLGAGTVKDITIDGTRAYIALSGTGLVVVNVTDPAAPAYESAFNYAPAISSVSVSGGLAYLTDESTGLRVVALSSMSQVSSFSTAGSAREMKIANGKGYIAEAASGIQLVNLNPPNPPSLSATSDTPGIARGIDVVGDIIYVADGNYGLRVLQDAYPGSVMLLGTYSFTGDAYAVKVVGGRAYVAADWGGLQVIDLQGRPSGWHDTTGQAREVSVEGNYAYLADGTGGLRIFQIGAPPTDIALSTATVAENQPAGTVVGNLSATDPEDSSGFTFALVSGAGSDDNASFTVTSGGQLKTAAMFDYEWDSSYTIRVRVTDPAGYTFEKPLTVTITDVAGEPTDITLSEYRVYENRAVGTVIGTFSTADAPGSTHTYNFVDGTYGAGNTYDNALFTISASGQLLTNAVFDRETKSAYMIRIRSTNQNGLFIDEAFSIVVRDENEAPTNITLSTASVNENRAVGWTIGSFSTTDPDIGSTFTYSLVAGTSSTHNALFSISGNQLKVAGSIDHESTPTCTIRVRSTDGGGLWFEKVFTITVQNVFDVAPTDIALSNASFAENRLAWTLVGTLSTSDVEAGDAFTYSLVAGAGDTDNASFVISGDMLQTAVIADYETKSQYSVRVRSRDRGMLWVEKAFTISVTDVDEVAPTVQSVSINDGAAQRSMVKKAAVVFAEAVDLYVDAFRLQKPDGTLVPDTTLAVTNPSADQRSYIVTFGGSGVVGGSLRDGVYDLVVDATKVYDLAGNPMGGDYTQRFHRLFGDSNGDRRVNLVDYRAMRTTLGKASGQGLFNAALDYDGGGVVNVMDLTQFRRRFGGRVVYS